MKIMCNKHYKELIEMIIQSGNEVNGTYEVIGEQIIVPLITSAGVQVMMDVPNNLKEEFILALDNLETKQIGPYDTSYYLFMVNSVKALTKTILDDCLETRRAVIQFPVSHCFQSIQFLIRENTIHVICTMRSCNAIKNLPMDMWICGYLADIYREAVKKVFGISLYDTYKITMNIGSLHVFKEDINDVF